MDACFVLPGVFNFRYAAVVVALWGIQVGVGARWRESFAGMVKVLLATGQPAKLIAIAALVLIVSMVAVSCRDEWRNAPLIIAANNGDLKGIRRALDNGADPNCTGVIYANYRSGLKYRLRAILHLRSPQSPVPVAFIAIHSGGDEPRPNRCQMVSMLVKAGADPNARDGYGGTQLTGLSGDACDEGIQVLLEHGADPNLCNPGDLTPLMLASNSDRLTSVKLLISAGADKHRTTSRGETALTLAEQRLRLGETRRPLDCRAIIALLRDDANVTSKRR